MKGDIMLLKWVSRFFPVCKPQKKWKILLDKKEEIEIEILSLDIFSISGLAKVRINHDEKFVSIRIVNDLTMADKIGEMTIRYKTHCLSIFIRVRRNMKIFGPEPLEDVKIVVDGETYVDWKTSQDKYNCKNGCNG